MIVLDKISKARILSLRSREIQDGKPLQQNQGQKTGINKENNASVHIPLQGARGERNR